MKSTRNILPEIWEEIENKKQTKQDIKILSYLDHDILQSIILDDSIYWYESMSYATIPRYVYAYFDKLLAKKGYTYLYNINK
jgi:hypothetical protein